MEGIGSQDLGIFMNLARRNGLGGGPYQVKMSILRRAEIQTVAVLVKFQHVTAAEYIVTNVSDVFRQSHMPQGKLILKGRVTDTGNLLAVVGVRDRHRGCGNVHKVHNGIALAIGVQPQCKAFFCVDDITDRLVVHNAYGGFCSILLGIFHRSLAASKRQHIGRQHGQYHHQGQQTA